MRTVIHAPRPLKDYGRASRVLKPPFRGRLSGAIGQQVVVRLLNGDSGSGLLTYAGPTYSGIRLDTGQKVWARNIEIARVVVK